MNPSAEFDVVEQLRELSGSDPAVVLGIGDDAAIIALTEGNHLVTCVDTLIEGVHFPQDTAPAAIGHKSLAVNLSDLAAMGARPRWALLALSLGQPDSRWVAEFVRGWQALATKYSVALVGGDTTRTPGPLTVSAQLIGELPAGQALTRSGASPGDLVALTGSLGGAALALQRIMSGETLSVDERQRLDCPEPRVMAGATLMPLASACIDLSDGLAADLPHILADSDVGAKIDVSKLPLHSSLKELSTQAKLDLALAGGDDYELCFCYRPGCHSMITELLGQTGVPFTVIGEICSGSELQWVGQGDCQIAQGYGHFRG